MKNNNLVKAIKKLARQDQMFREANVGRNRASTFGGKPDIQKDRKSSKNMLKCFDENQY